jgi:DNA replication regulator SLD3
MKGALAGRKPAGDKVESTPVRNSVAPNPFLRVVGVDEPSFPPSSPLMARKSSTSQLLTVPASVIKSRPSLITSAPADDSDPGMFETPVKCKAVKAGIRKYEETDMKGAELMAGISEGKQLSIYQRLGWDDNFDDLS